MPDKPPEKPPDDPFGDLGEKEAARRRREAIGDALAERDRVDPEPMDRPPEVPRPGNKYAWVVGLVMLMIASALLLRAIAQGGGEGVRGPQRGELLPAFAAPLTSSNVDENADANICREEPCPERAGAVPACEVRSEEVLNLCELRQRPLVLTFVVTAGADCEPQVDRVERIRDEFPDLDFAVVMSGNNIGEAKAIAERRGWNQPVGVDHDGAVVNIYGIGVCPVTVFALPGGIVFETGLGNLTEDELRQKASRLERRMTMGPTRGERLPVFADANICQQEPCAEEEGAVPACEDRTAGLSLCELRRRPVVLSFAVSTGGRCEPQAGMRRPPNDVSFATVVEPSVAKLYGIGRCPTTIFARRGGRVVETVTGELSIRELRARTRELADLSG